MVIQLGHAGYKASQYPLTGKDFLFFQMKKMVG